MKMDVLVGGEPELFFVKSEFWEPFMAQSQDNIVYCHICNWSKIVSAYVAIGLNLRWIWVDL